MFSTGEYDYIKNLTLDFYNQGYTEYLCITNNPTSSYNSYNIYDVECYYSKEPLTLTSYQLTLSSDTQKCSFDSNTKSDNNTIDKLICQSQDGTVNLDSQEYIYSNLGNYSNIIADYEQQNTFYNNFNLVLLSILSILIITYLTRFVSKILRR